MRAERRVRVGMIGLGVVGSAFVRLLEKAFDDKQTEIEIIKVAVRRKHAPRNCNIDPQLITDNPLEVVDHPNIDVLIELAGGENMADLILRAIANGKHIITANKSMLAAHGPNILAAAKSHQVYVGYEASCGGAIPIIKSLRERFTMNAISHVTGILNGTTNFILDVMENELKTYDDALKIAQEKGLAEADPTADVEGYDAVSKLQILSSLAFKSFVSRDKIFREGISGLASEDINMLAQCGLRIKLLAQADCLENGIGLSVRPVALPCMAIAASVKGAQNYIELEDANAGKSIFIGEGAGGLPTATAVLQDLIDICRAPSLSVLNAQTNGFEQNPHKSSAYVATDEVNEAYCIRVVIPENANAYSNQLKSLFSTKSVLFRSEDSFYLLIQSIAHKQLQTTLLSAKQNNIITSFYAFAIHPTAFNLLKQYGLRCAQQVTCNNQAMALVGKTQKSSIQYQGTVFAPPSLTLVTETASETQNEKKRSSFGS